jgi:hypothetical protein
MFRSPTALAALAALLVTAFLAGCGGSDKKSIPSDEAAVLIRHLQKARDAAGNSADCPALQRAVAATQADVQSLPSSVDKDTRDTLVNGVNNLQDTAQQECAGATTTTDTTPTTETTPPTTTETTPPTTTETTPPTTTETTPPTTDTQTTPPTTPSETVPGNGGTPGAKGPGNAPGQEKKGGPKDHRGKEKGQKE